MSDFLTCLNTADLDTLTQVPVITRQLAGNLISARPFETFEECLRVKGMGRTLLGKLEIFAEVQGNASENRSMVPVPNDALPAYMEKSEPAQEKVKDEDSFLKRLGRAFVSFLRALLKLILLAMLVVGVGALFAFGLPYLQNTFIAPVEQNTSQIRNLEEQIASLQTQLDETNVRIAALESSVEAHTLSIQNLEEMQAALETELQNNNDALLLELKHEVMLTRALDILARGRLYLSQSNFGLARVDVESARDLLVELQAETNDEILVQAIVRLNMALGNLPDFPVVASGDLEIAWQILMSGKAPATPSFTPTPFDVTFTPTPFDVTFTPTPFDVTFTPTPFLPAEATATP